MPVELLRLDELQLNVRTVTENVSPRGACICDGMELRSGQASPAYRFGAGVKSLARVVYCQPLQNTKFAVGLQLVVRVEEWGNPATHE